MCISRSTRYRYGDISLGRYIVTNLSCALRDIATAIFRKNDISARYLREAPISRQIIVATRRFHVRYITEISPRYRRNIVGTKRDIQRLSFGLLLHSTVITMFQFQWKLSPFKIYKQSVKYVETTCINNMLFDCCISILFQAVWVWLLTGNIVLFSWAWHCTVPLSDKYHTGWNYYHN